MIPTPVPFRSKHRIVQIARGNQVKIFRRLQLGTTVGFVVNFVKCLEMSLNAQPKNFPQLNSCSGRSPIKCSTVQYSIVQTYLQFSIQSFILVLIL